MTDELVRCHWPGEDPLYVAYHDDEWGVPEFDDRALYEKLVLDGFQAGLSWITILRKRENFRRAFDEFSPEKIARYGKRETNRLLRDEGIIRSRAKIEAAIRGARLWLDILEKEPGGFSGLIWKHVDGRPRVNHYKAPKQIPAKTPMSENLAKELKQRGFNFCGPVIVYAFAQAIGMVNDHIVSCHRHAACEKLARQPRPR
ncbi:MAG: DNA-3-methyladenine glycosylase I [Alphaproteobacteria bacterium]|nr:DNA-3-methyladenine glycosylase I [Alphaproteobacteria bacterium]MDE2111936.1 DNA-3-methyladenine glycosylase I [Alphaproteobacteria bacterium]MDE2493121.1 DNA-3-methyladenine glycosylase I [Alphaproteobacteria bacterium]